MPRRRTKRIQLTADYVRQILDYNPDTGLLTWRPRNTFAVGWNTRWVGKPAGSFVKGYFQIQIDGANYYVHRLAWLHVYGVWAPHQIDHINGDRADNRLANLRLATNAQNCRNKAMQINNQSGFIGVHFDHQRGKWRAKINRDHKIAFDGFFDTAEEAATARAGALERIHGEFAALNRK